jgi:hypothetical protein
LGESSCPRNEGIPLVDVEVDGANSACAVVHSVGLPDTWYDLQVEGRNGHPFVFDGLSFTVPEPSHSLRWWPPKPDLAVKPPVGGALLLVRSLGRASRAERG